MWKRKRTSEQQRKSSLLTEGRSQVRNDALDPESEARRTGLYDGDLTQGDEGIDDPPEHV